MSSAYEEFSSFSLGNLKDYLSARGLSCQGNKQQLVSRCYVAWENKVQLREIEKDKLPQLEREYVQRLEEAGCTDPRDIPTANWSSDVTAWPEVDLGKIFSYIMSTKEHGMEFVGQYKTNKAYSYYISGFVDTVFSTKVNNTVIIKSKVTPSQSVRNEPHDTWVALDFNGNIKTCWCSCIAGFSKTCNHVIAVLYKVEYANTMGFTKPSCTTLPCQWNTSGKKNVQPAKVSELNIRRDNRSKVSGAVTDRGCSSLHRLQFDPRREDQRTVASSSVQSLYAGLYKISKESVLFKGLPLNLPSRSNHLPAPLPLLAKSDPEMFVTRVNQGFTSQQVVLIENGTRGQANNNDWKEQRKGRLTASLHHDIVMKMNTIAKSKDVVVSKLAARVMGLSPNLSHIPAIRYGIENEDQARQEFAENSKKFHIGFSVTECGLYVKQERPYLACSPDGLVTCQCHGKSLLEIKCPYVLRDGSTEVDWHKTDFLEKKEGSIHLKRNHRYYTQIQSQMAITGISNTNFFVWTPNSSPNFTENICFEASSWLENQQKLSQFFSSFLLPYLLGNKEIHLCQKCESVCLQQEELKQECESSIMCNCCNVWYHFLCAGLKSAPKEESWLCTSCASNAMEL